MVYEHAMGMVLLQRSIAPLTRGKGLADVVGLPGDELLQKTVWSKCSKLNDYETFFFFPLLVMSIRLDPSLLECVL